MPVVVVGSVALDTIETPFGKTENALGGSASYFSLAARFFCPAYLVAVVGEDMPADRLALLSQKNIKTEGLKQVPGKTFRWTGRYEEDLNTRETLDLQLNVFEEFEPEIPAGAQDCEYVFLGNIHPQLQAKVLDQFPQAKLVGCDTIDHWILNERQALLNLFSKVNLVVINDAEARMLAQTPNLKVAARWIRARGPEFVVIKKGEHGVLMYHHDEFFAAPAFLLDEVFDPTGAGDSFAGGLMGYLAQARALTPEVLRCGIVNGTVLASYCVEQFGVQRLVSLTDQEVEERFVQFHRLTQFGDRIRQSN
ncbi:MAG: sugar kinase [Candidatus Omnitrophica bacterium]|nr:sugar kinase [Candidatus Omnitrophota bacterium]